MTTGSPTNPPGLGNPTNSPTTARSPSWSTRSATSTGSSTWPARRACASRTCSRPTSTTTTSPAASRWPRRSARPTTSTPTTRSTSSASASATATSSRSATRCGPRRAHPRPHPPTCRTPSTRRRAPVAVFTGGSLLFGSTGRPDLLGPDHTDTLVRAQWHSAHRLAEELPDETEVYPTHGFGSFCSATQTRATSSTIGQEKTSNPALTQGEQEYVEELLAGLDEFPAYYAHMGPANSAGPGRARPVRARARRPAELRRRIDAGEWVVDLRTRSAFAAGHLTGSLNFGLDGQFITYLGWLIPGAPPSRCSARPPSRSPRRSGTWSGSASSARRRWPPASPRTGPTRRAGVLPGRHVRTSLAELRGTLGRVPVVLDVPRPGVRRGAHRRRGEPADPPPCSPTSTTSPHAALGPLRGLATAPAS